MIRSRPTGQGRRTLLALLTGSVLLGLGACTPTGFDPLASPTPTPTGVSGTAPSPATTPAASRAARPADAQTSVERLFAAAAAGNRSGWVARTDATDPSFEARSAMLFDNLRTLRPTRLQVRLTGAEQPVPDARRRALGAGARIVQAELSWRLPGETADARASVWLTLVPGPDGPRLAGTDDGTALDRPALPLWWLAPVRREVRGDATVVVGPGQDADRWAGLARRAATDAREHLPRTLRDRWDEHLVVQVPKDEADFARVLGAAPGTYAGTAAVTRPEGPTTRAAVRVVVNPATADDSDAELGTTLTHETVHVATRSARSPAPLWAVEGLAEYVALEAHPDQRAAELDAFRSAPPPSRLPADAAFTAGGKDVSAAYAQAWLACKAIASHRGRTDLGRFYAALDDGASVGKAARTTLGVDPEVVVGWWQDAMTAAAGGRG